MTYSHDRMGPEHSGPGVFHYPHNSFPHRGLITMYRAFPAGGFKLRKSALAESNHGIVEKFLAICAEPVFRSMLLFAVQANHCRNSMLFALDSPAF